MRSRSEIPFETRKLSLHEGSMRRLATLRENTEATSDSEVVRQALLYYEQLVDDVAQGNEVFIRQPDDDGAHRDIAITVHSAEDVTGDEIASVSSEGDLVKRNLVLPQAAARRLDDLRLHSGARSDSQVIREAIIVYDKLVSNAMNGKFVVVRDAGGREHYKSMPIPKTKRPNQLLRRLQRALDSVPS